MLTDKMSGIFDCRKYDQSGKLAHDQRAMLLDTDNITFSALIPINDVPDMFKTNGELDEFARPKASRKEREAAQAENRQPVPDMVVVRFKIGANCKWFDKFAKPCERPTNAELEKSRFNVQLDFRKKEKDPANPLKPSGYWGNSIMFSPIETNPFAGQAFEERTDDAETVNEMPEADGNNNEFNDDLPFA